MNRILVIVIKRKTFIYKHRIEFLRILFQCDSGVKPTITDNSIGVCITLAIVLFSAVVQHILLSNVLLKIIHGTINSSGNAKKINK